MNRGRCRLTKALYLAALEAIQCDGVDILMVPRTQSPKTYFSSRPEISISPKEPFRETFVHLMVDHCTQSHRPRDGASRRAKSLPEQEDMPSGVGKAATRLLQKLKSEEPGPHVSPRHMERCAERTQGIANTQHGSDSWREMVFLVLVHTLTLPCFFWNSSCPIRSHMTLSRNLLCPFTRLV